MNLPQHLSWCAPIIADIAFVLQVMQSVAAAFFVLFISITCAFFTFFSFAYRAFVPFYIPLGFFFA